MKLKLTVEIPSNKISSKSCMPSVPTSPAFTTFSQAVNAINLANLTVKIPPNKISYKSCMPSVPTSPAFTTFSQAVNMANNGRYFDPLSLDEKKDEKEDFKDQVLNGGFIVTDETEQSFMLPEMLEFPFFTLLEQLGVDKCELRGWDGAVKHISIYCKTGRWQKPDIHGNTKLRCFGDPVGLNKLWEYLGMSDELQEQQVFLQEEEKKFHEEEEKEFHEEKQEEKEFHEEEEVFEEEQEDEEVFEEEQEDDFLPYGEVEEDEEAVFEEDDCVNPYGDD
jgi:hypothetical protein